MAKVKYTNQESKKNYQPPDVGRSRVLNLDTSELSDTGNGDGGFSGDRGRLKKRARQKSIGKVLMLGLIDRHSLLERAYKLTYGFCAEVLLHDETKITSRYCGYRWCPVCNRIRTAKLIDGYQTAFSQFKDPYMVTLTAPTGDLSQLPDELEKRKAVWSAILKYHKTLYNRHQVTFKLNGIKKLEVSPRPDGQCHPHYHLIVDGLEQAKFIKRQWLYRMPSADHRLQDIRKADKSSLIELFKYVSKYWSKDKKTGKIVIGTPHQMDQIFQALKNKRTIRPFGKVRMVSDEVEKLRSEEIADVTPRVDISLWDQAVMDWIDTYGECISGYKPTEKDKQLIQQIEQTIKTETDGNKKDPPG